MRNTSEDGIYYWRRSPNEELPPGKLPNLRKEPYKRTPLQCQQTPLAPFGIVDSDWASDTSHRKSISGIGCMYAGAVVAYKSAYQKSVADSSTEAEFYALVECAKMMLYLRSVLEDLGINQTFATPIFEDNKGAIDIVRSGKPTKRVCHVDTKQFIIIDWVEIDLVDILKISTHDNSSDVLTKALPKALLYRHNEVLMGKIRPPYSTFDLLE